ncbi:MAG: hypothetical protein K2H25_04230, partial [Alistipes sp.]|nr:hypothetical protein [Alistipes sp.]
MKRIESFVRRSLWALLVTALVGAGCSEDPTDPSPAPAEKTDDASIDRWMFNYMKTHYLWNEAVQKITPDYSLGYEKFLDDILEKVAAQTDETGRPVNYDDGHWTADETGKPIRSSFYSNIRRYKKSKTALGGGIRTRGTHKQTEGLGIEVMFYMSRNGDRKAPYVF